jgi:hypothetical protein
MNELPKCPKCNKHVLLPFSDFGGDNGAAAVKWKAWVCADTKCGYSVRIDKGKIRYEIVH